MRQEKFKRGKEKMLSIAQDSGDGQTLVQPEDDDDDDDGMRKIGNGLCRLRYVTVSDVQGEWKSYNANLA